MMKKNSKIFLSAILYTLTPAVFSATDTINLVISEKTIHFTDAYFKAIAINDQIPGPTLHFKEGDTVKINVFNHLDKETALHWHGVFVPWQMDGVMGINQKGIPPKGVFHYQFTLKQSGTYWYHAHAGLQEQQGLYGAFIIDPLTPSAYHYDKDYVIVLSDWINADPEQVLANLKKTGDYYAPRFPLQPSLTRFLHDYHKANAETRIKLSHDYQAMQKMRMSLYDLSDVAYDTFLLNGKTKTDPWKGKVNVGDVVRLRFIGAGGSTIFHVKITETTMQVVHVDGNDVVPFSINNFMIAPGETYDVLVHIQKDQPYVIYAESNDTVGAVWGALVTNSTQKVSWNTLIPFAEPQPVTDEMMTVMKSPMIQGKLPAAQKSHAMTMNHHAMPMSDMHDMSSMGMDSHAMPMSDMHDMSSMGMDSHAMRMSSMHDMSSMGMNHSSTNMEMPTEPTVIGDHISAPENIFQTSSATKYTPIKSPIPTNDPNVPLAGVIRMELFGYMDRFIWFINGVPEHKAHPIVLQPGKRYRLIFTNTSMMHHPMHIHGHWFILREGHDAYDPLLHTIDVPPGATITADLDTDASGQWIFHCHFLYHMMAGMARTFQYSSLIEIIKDTEKPQDIVKDGQFYNRPIVRVDEVRPIDVSLVKHPMAHPERLWFATFLDVGVNPVTNIQKVTYKGLYGGDYQKLELFMNDAEVSDGSVQNADLDIFYWHLLNQFWAVKGGVNYFYRPSDKPYFQPGLGIEGLLPYFIDTDVRGYFYSGSVKWDAEFTRDTQITNNFFIELSIRGILATKTVENAAIGSGLNQMQYTIHPYYRVMPGLSLFMEYEHDQYYGPFKNIQIKNFGNSNTDNALTFGISIVV